MYLHEQTFLPCSLEASRRESLSIDQIWFVIVRDKKGIVLNDDDELDKKLQKHDVGKLQRDI